MKHNYLITGGIGFIGSNLTCKLLQNNHQVTVIDNFDSYYDPKIKIKNLKRLDKFDNFSFKNLDILKFELCKRQLNEKFSAIVHLAAYPGVRNSFIKPKKAYHVNVKGTENMCKLAVQKKITKFIFTSSSSVYGINPNIPWSENDQSLFPISPYAKSKLEAELICKKYSNNHNISFDILRLFSVYGQNQRPDLAIMKFISLILQNKEIPFFGNGTTYRDYTNVVDIIDGIIKTLAYKHEGYEIFNLGSGKMISLTYLIETIENCLNKKAIINYLPNQQGDVDFTYANILKASKYLNYKPSINFEDGVRNFVQWFIKQGYSENDL